MRSRTTPYRLAWWCGLLVFCLVAARPSVTRADDREEVTAWFYAAGTLGLKLKETAEAFNEAQNQYRVSVMLVPWNSNQKLLSALAAGIPPDVAMVDRPATPGWVLRGALEDITEFVDREGWTDQDFFTAPWNDCRYGGRSYLVPLHNDIRCLIYNRDLFRRAGLDPDRPPQTWEELLEYSRRLTVWSLPAILGPVGATRWRRQRCGQGAGRMADTKGRRAMVSSGTNASIAEGRSGAGPADPRCQGEGRGPDGSSAGAEARGALAGGGMGSQERVMAALGHTRPDRLPRYEIFFPSFTAAWRRAKGLPADADPATHYHIDIPGLLAVQAGPFLSQALPECQEGAFLMSRDSWGRTLRRLPDSGFIETAAVALDTKAGLDRLPFEDPTSAAYEALVPLVGGLPRRDQARVSGTMGLFQACTWLRGGIPLMLDLLDDEPFCHALVTRLVEFLAPFGELVARRTGTVESAFWVYDDFSINTGPMISPEVFERVFLEPYRRLLGRWRGIGIRHLILHHDVLSEASFPIVDQFVEAGITGVQGVYPTAGLTLLQFRKRYGKRLAVIGGMCNTHTLPFGSRREIEREVASVVEAAADGGVIIGSHSIEGYIPVPNYDLYISALDAAGSRH